MSCLGGGLCSTNAFLIYLLHGTDVGDRIGIHCSLIIGITLSLRWLFSNENSWGQGLAKPRLLVICFKPGETMCEHACLGRSLNPSFCFPSFSCSHSLPHSHSPPPPPPPPLNVIPHLWPASDVYPGLTGPTRWPLLPWQLSGELVGILFFLFWFFVLGWMFSSVEGDGKCVKSSSAVSNLNSKRWSQWYKQFLL